MDLQFGTFIVSLLVLAIASAAVFVSRLQYSLEVERRQSAQAEACRLRGQQALVRAFERARTLRWQALQSHAHAMYRIRLLTVAYQIESTIDLGHPGMTEVLDDQSRADCYHRASMELYPSGVPQQPRTFTRRNDFRH